jgi:hypothetical protein
MWLLTQIGFFSVVADLNDAERLLVRARVRGDLDALRERYLPDLEIIEGAGTDYRFRAFVRRAEFEQAARSLAEDIDYPDFKDVVVSHHGYSRAALYSQISSLLHTLQGRGS